MRQPYVRRYAVYDDNDTLMTTLCSGIWWPTRSVSGRVYSETRSGTNRMTWAKGSIHRLNRYGFAHKYTVMGTGR